MRKNSWTYVIAIPLLWGLIYLNYRIGYESGRRSMEYVDPSERLPKRIRITTPPVDGVTGKVYDLKPFRYAKEGDDPTEVRRVISGKIWRLQMDDFTIYLD